MFDVEWLTHFGFVDDTALPLFVHVMCVSRGYTNLLGGISVLKIYEVLPY